MSVLTSLSSVSSSPSRDWVNFRVEYLRTELLSKLGTISVTPGERRQAAIDKWLAVDLLNARTNQRLCWSDTTLRLKRRGVVTTDEVLERAAIIIKRTIGIEPPRDILSHGLFSNGASTRVKRLPDAIARKYVGKADVTEDCWRYFLPEMISNRLWWTLNEDALHPNFIRGNIMFTVPKNSQIDRVACKEPEINMLAQKSVGDYIRAKLLRTGINLNDQTINQKLALEGSKHRTLATIDLSSASDSISRMLVSRLLPAGWFVLLDAIRSKETCIDGVWKEPNMFSSMGNGFTFELESLIFYALARSCAFYTGESGSLSVYGDDIIVPGALAPFLINVLGFCGFKTNVKKTHFKTSDPFRESCGKHYYAGNDVTPFYVRQPINDVSRVIHFLNHVTDWFELCPDILLSSFWAKWARYVPRAVWGGKDLSAIDSLYTPDRPRKRIIRAKGEIQADNTGAYLQWLHMRCDNVRPDPQLVDLTRIDNIDEWLDRLVTSSISIDEPRWVYRPNRVWHRPVHDSLFVYLSTD